MGRTRRFARLRALLAAVPLLALLLPLLGAAIAVLMLTMVPIVVGGLAVGGFFDALLERFVSDGGRRISMCAPGEGNSARRPADRTACVRR